MGRLGQASCRPLPCTYIHRLHYKAPPVSWAEMTRVRMRLREKKKKIAARHSSYQRYLLFEVPYRYTTASYDLHRGICNLYREILAFSLVERQGEATLSSIHVDAVVGGCVRDSTIVSQNGSWVTSKTHQGESSRTRQTGSC
ncbi:hypothetical protein F5X96DRAFT_637992 [Biscogniauxia mediterranea]|nr:hypothetical protein F5X96DRAFT_637992 [Biscogniauxia mediterranea]